MGTHGKEAGERPGFPFLGTLTSFTYSLVFFEFSLIDKALVNFDSYFDWNDHLGCNKNAAISPKNAKRWVIPM